MRGDQPGSPVLSTYTVGNGPPARRTTNLAYPVAAILGTVSAAAIVTLAFDSEAPTASEQQSGTSDQAPRAMAEGPAAIMADAAPSPSFETLPVAGPEIPPPGLATARGEGATEARDRALPYLSVLQSTAAEPAARPTGERRANLAPRADPPREPMLARAEAPSQSAAGCVGDCLAGEAPGDEPESRPANAGPELAAGQAIGPPPTEAGPIMADLAAAPGPIAVDSGPDAALLADARPAVLIEPAGGAGAAPAAPVAEPAAPLIAPASPTAEPAGPSQVAAAGASSNAVASDSAAPSTTIQRHLARIGERYSAASTAAPRPPVADTAAQSTPESPGGASAVAVGIDGLSSSTVIVQEDELVAIRLGELVSLLEDRLDHPLYVWMKSSAAASKFVTAETLAAAGIHTRYDPQRRQIVFSTGE